MMTMISPEVYSSVERGNQKFQICWFSDVRGSLVPFSPSILFLFSVVSTLKLSAPFSTTKFSQVYTAGVCGWYGCLPALCAPRHSRS